MDDYTPEAWQAEYDALISCRNDMSEYGEFSLNRSDLSITDALAGLIAKHGQDRVSIVLSTTVNLAITDPRYTHHVREWSQNVPSFPAPPHYTGEDFKHWQICSNAHPCSVNIAARLHMAYIAAQNLNTPKAHAKSPRRMNRGGNTR